MKSDLSQARAVITGAGGFIGSHLAEALLKKKVEVHLILSKGQTKGNNAGNAKIHHADLRDSAAIKKCIAEISPHKVFHLAAFTNATRMHETSIEAIKTNLIGTLNLLHAIDTTTCDHFINTGTCEEYGQNKPPFRETQAPDPVSPYSASKSAAVLFCNMYHRTCGYPITTLRPFLTYGPRQDKRMFVPSLINAALKGEDFKMTEGAQTREMNYVTDIIDGYIKASVSKKAIGETINIGSGEQYSLRHIAEKINELTGSRTRILFGAIPYRDNEIWHLYCDNSKAKRLLGIEQKVGLEEGLKRTISWYRKNTGN